jgi:hypothetical protein
LAKIVHLHGPYYRVSPRKMVTISRLNKKAVQPQICRMCVAQVFYSRNILERHRSHFLFLPSNFPCAFACPCILHGKPCRRWPALCNKAKACHATSILRASAHCLPCGFAQLGKPPVLRSSAILNGTTLFAYHAMPRGRGWTNREYAHLAQA